MQARAEADLPRPCGDYAGSCLGRERIFTHFSLSGRIGVALLRLNYATEMGYGVLVDLCQQVLSGAAVDLTMGYFNASGKGIPTP